MANINKLGTELSAGLQLVRDPGDTKTIQLDGRGYGVCEVVTEGAETRVLQDATQIPVGTEILVIFKTDGGDLTIQSDDSDVVLDNAGDCAKFVVSRSGTTKVWRLLSSNT